MGLCRSGKRPVVRGEDERLADGVAIEKRGGEVDRVQRAEHRWKRLRRPFENGAARIDEREASEELQEGAPSPRELILV